MQSSKAVSQALSVVIIIAIILVALVGYAFAATYGRTSSTSQRGQISMTTASSGSLLSQLTTYTTVTRTTLSFGGSTYLATTGEYSGCIPPVQCYPTTVTTEIVQSATSSESTNLSTVTYSTYSTFVNTFFSASCVFSAGGFEFRIVSDSTGSPVNPVGMSAVDSVGCNSESQTVYTSEFSNLGGGWFVPVLPSQASFGGEFSITVTYEGITYNFTGAVPPIGTDCVTLHVPSGSVSSSTVMNGSGSYCS